MLIINGATQRVFKQSKPVADYYADNQRQMILQTVRVQTVSVANMEWIPGARDSANRDQYPETASQTVSDFSATVA